MSLSNVKGKKVAHLNLAHAYWKKILTPQDLVIDATCGNGYDTLFLNNLGVKVVGYDIQEKAIEQTRQKVPTALLRLRSHHLFVEKTAALIIYNLGYLPGGDKTLTTKCDTTLKSVKRALEIATKAITITCYPGHTEGAKEQALLLDFLRSIDHKKWSICFHQWLNRKNAPSVLLLSNLFASGMIKNVPEIKISSSP